MAKNAVQEILEEVSRTKRGAPDPQAEARKIVRARKGRKVTAAAKRWVVRYAERFTDHEMAEALDLDPVTIQQMREESNVQTSFVRSDEVEQQLREIGRFDVPPEIIKKIVLYKRSVRFRHFYSILNKGERDYFDSQFTELVVDLCSEGDLTPQEINGVIDLVQEYISQFRFQYDLQSTGDPEARKDIETAYRKSKDSSARMLRDLRVTRKQRLDESKPQKLSIVHLIEAWRKEQSRQYMIQRAKLAQEEELTIYEQLKNPKLGKALILGFDPSKGKIDFDLAFKDIE